MIVFDIETNGLYGDRIWVLSYYNISTKESGYITDYQEMREFLNEGKTLIGHNIIRFDIPFLEKILKIRINNPVIDTLPLSQYLWDNKRKSHGLESWGETFGIPKPKIIDWNNPGILSEYIRRCNEDVRINTKLYLLEDEFLNEIYSNKKYKLRLIRYLNWKLDCFKEQEKNPIPLNIPHIQEGIDLLKKKLDEKIKILSDIMPKNIIYRKYIMPKKMRKADGSLSVLGRKWLDYLNENDLPTSLAETKKIVKVEKGNPLSPKQIKEWLFSLGWKPISFKINEKGKKVPQVRVDGKLCVSINPLMEIHKELIHYEDLGTIKSRLNNLENFLKNEKDGKIVADSIGITNTLRFKHRNIVNLPGVGLPYGKLVRDSLTAPEGHLFIGCDMKSLETRTKLHYIHPLDSKYVDEVMNDPSYDPHLDIALIANLLTQEEIDWYKANKNNHDLNDDDKKKFTELSNIRHIAKQGNYAATYGVGAKKLSLAIKKPISVAKKIISSFKKKNWAMYEVSDNFKKKKVRGILFVYNPVSKFWMHLRNEKDVFSVINQSTGVFVFDLFIKFVRETYKISLQQHDEIGFFCKEGSLQKNHVKVILKDNIRRVNSIVKLNVELDISIEFGKTYADVH